jgi:hypothetical protein
MGNAINRFASLIDNAQIHIPFSAQWAVLIDFPDNFASNIPDISNLEGPGWNAARSNVFFNGNEPIVEYFGDDGIGCIFADEVNQIGDNYGVSDATIGDDGTTGGIIPGIYSKSRESFAQKKLSIKFRETSVSFVDFVIRPWIIMASHYGRIADANTIIKSEINIISFSKKGSSASNIRKVFTYFGCTPSSLTDIKLTYDKDVVMGYEVGWVFDRYAIREEIAIPAVAAAELGVAAAPTTLVQERPSLPPTIFDLDREDFTRRANNNRNPNTQQFNNPIDPNRDPRFDQLGGISQGEFLDIVNGRGSGPASNSREAVNNFITRGRGG